MLQRTIFALLMDAIIRLRSAHFVATKRKVSVAEGQVMQQTSASNLFALFFCACLPIRNAFTTLSSSPSSAPHHPQQEPSQPTSSRQPALPREVQPHAPLSSSPPRAFPPPGASSSRLEYELLVRLRGRVIQGPLVRIYDCGDLDDVPGIFYCRWLDQDQ